MKLILVACLLLSSCRMEGRRKGRVLAVFDCKGDISFGKTVDGRRAIVCVEYHKP